MRAVLQRVRSGAVHIDQECVGSIGHGLVILLGVHADDEPRDADYLAEKCLNLRIFSDDDGKFNLSVIDVTGDLLVVSQFTLYGDCRKGRRPSFIAAARPEHSIPLYERFVAAVGRAGLRTETGRFGANMRVSIENDGPVTVIVESKGG